VAGGCSGNDATETASASGSLRGVIVDSAAAYFSGDSFLLSRSRSAIPVQSRSSWSQCGRLAVTRLARTRFEPEGIDQPGSIGAAKELALRSQRFRQGPETMVPRDDRLPVPDGGDCVRRDPPVSLSPGDEVDEVYSIRLDRSSTVFGVGSEHALVQTDVIFAAADLVRFSDIYSAYDAENAFREHRLRVVIPLSDLVQIDPSAEAGMSDGEVFDRLMEYQALRDWMLERDGDDWREADLNRFSRGTAARPEFGDDVRLRLMPYPGEEDPWVLAAELEVGDLHLPSGRIVITDGSFLAADEAVLHNSFPPGTYGVTVTTARPPDDDGEFEAVAVATVHGSTTPVRWETALTYEVEPGELGPDELFAVAVDGGTIGIGSAEVVAELLRRFDTDEDEYWSVTGAAFDRLTAYDYTAVSHPVDELQFFVVSSGFGDGRYPIWVGFDENGNVAQLVVEFGVVYLEFRQ
jgi:hypothetical protein